MKTFINWFLFILLLIAEVQAQTATQNIGFEDGSFDGWQCYIGNIDVGGNITVTESSPTIGRHTVYSKAYAEVMDPYGNFPILCPNGSNYSIKLGDTTTGGQAERITYTLTVPNKNAFSIIFDYAVVLQNPNHQAFQQPKFTVKIFDLTDGVYIDCPSFNFVASSSLPGFKLSNLIGARGASIYYKDWSTATIDLHNYTGKMIRLEFTANDCTVGGHFGYAYLDINENTDNPIAGNAYCLGQKSITLFAPNGFAGYQWYNADFSQQIGQGQSLTLSPPPPDMTKYALKIFPYPQLGCVDTLYTVVNQINEGFKLNVKDTVHGCPETGVDITAPIITAGSSAGMTLTYFNDALGTSHLYNPNNITTPGTYYIQGVNKDGCMNILPVTVALDVPMLSISDPAPVTFPATVDLSKSFTHQAGVVYGYYTNAEATTPVQNYTTVKHSDTYYIKAENSYGCTSIAPVKAVIYPPPPYTVTAPTAFTPNNDGINDHFTVGVAGIITFGSVKVYTRYGKLVFTTKSPYDFWDGSYNGQKLPAGTYYWVFEGTDDYYNKKVNKAAYITLLR